MAMAPYPTTLAPAPLAVCSGAEDPVADIEPVAVRLPLMALVAADLAEPVAEAMPEETAPVGRSLTVTPAAAQREETAGASSMGWLVGRLEPRVWEKGTY
jgi:hypothetical protein